MENIKTSVVRLLQKLVHKGTDEKILSSQKMMLNNANSPLVKRKECLTEAISVADVTYNCCNGKEPINDEILRRLANSLGEVNERNEEKKKFIIVTLHVIICYFYNFIGRSKSMNRWGNSFAEASDLYGERG